MKTRPWRTFVRAERERAHADPGGPAPRVDDLQGAAPNVEGGDGGLGEDADGSVVLPDVAELLRAEVIGGGDDPAAVAGVAGRPLHPAGRAHLWGGEEGLPGAGVGEEADEAMGVRRVVSGALGGAGDVAEAGEVAGLPALSGAVGHHVTPPSAARTLDRTTRPTTRG